MNWPPLLHALSFEPRPFQTPMFWDQWYLLLLPLCLGVAIVYKSIKCNRMSRVPREALQLFLTIIVVMVIAAGALAGLVRILER